MLPDRESPPWMVRFRHTLDPWFVRLRAANRRQKAS